MTILEQLKNDGIHGLVTGARDGVHTLPDEVLRDYAEVEAITAQHADPRGRIADRDAARTLERLAARLGSAFAWGNGARIIHEHLAPALDTLLDGFADTRAKAAGYAHQPAPTLDMLDAPDTARTAYIRLHETYPKYGRLRASWLTLHRGEVDDPLGARSPLAEIKNIRDVVPDWHAAYHFRTPWPWPCETFHIRLGWLLDHGAHIWLPTPAQHNDAWRQHHSALADA